MLIEHLIQQQRERAAAGLTRERRVVEGPCAPHAQVRRGQGPARPMLTFASNDYLGLASHPALVRAWAEGAAAFGLGSGASHLLSGHTQAHVALEDGLARLFAPFIPDAAAITFSTGYMANVALLTALGRAGAVIFSDALNHASIVDGARLARAEVRCYAHSDMAGLERQLADCTASLRLIVTDAVFSMDGDLAPLATVLALAERFDAWVLLDDAHGFGVLGDAGQGSLAHWGLVSERLVCMGTMGKAAGLSGAFVVAHPVIIDALVQSARTYIFTTAPSPALAVAQSASLALIAGEEGRQRRARLQDHIKTLRAGLQALVVRHPALGAHLVDSPTAIQPLVVGSNDNALALARALEERGLWVPAIRPPSVPPGSARLRITLSAAHSTDDVDALLAALDDTARGWA